jgi:ribonuclease BN (tRNA processing enzyme)
VRLTVIGCAGSFPGPDSPASCYLIEYDGFRLVLDLGNGALGVLQRHVALTDIDAVVLSHLHADHCLDLCGLYVAQRYHPEGPRDPIPVWGPKGTAQRMARAYDLAEEPGMSGQFDFRGLIAGEHRIGPFLVTAARVNHPVEAYGLRVEAGGHAVVYSGDTAECPALIELARDADVAVFEASCLESQPAPGVHLTARQAAQHAQDAGAGMLVLTHLVAWNDPQATLVEARPAFEGEIVLAASGLVIDMA